MAVDVSRARASVASRRRFLSGTAGLAFLGGFGLLAVCRDTAHASTPVVVETAAQAAPADQPVVGKPMYQVDARRSGRSPHAGPRRAVLLRTFESGAFPTEQPAFSRPDIQSSSAIGPDGTIYIANFHGNLFALRDPGSGDRLEVAWRFHPLAASSLHATPALGADGSVYLAFSTGSQSTPQRSTLYALRAPASGIDGQVIWSIDLGEGRATASPLAGPDGTIYTVGGDGRLFAVAPSGALQWTAKAGPTLKGSPALGPDGTIYVPSMDGKLYAVSPPSGSAGEDAVRWTFDFGQHLGPTPLVTAQGGGGATGVGSGATPSIGASGTIYVGANNSNFYAVKPDGSLKWLFEAERELAGIWSAAALSADERTLYFGANKGGVYALDAAEGALRWRFDVYGSIYSSPALDREGRLYTGSTIGHLLALDSAAGDLIFDYDAGQQIWTAPAIRPDGSLVVADRAGRVMLFAAT